MALQLGLKGQVFLSSQDRTASLRGNTQREKVPVQVQQDSLAVLDNNFRVRGTTNLRVVDASVFPYIPGFFIVTPIYMIAEKASEMILPDAKQASTSLRYESAQSKEPTQQILN